MAFAAQNRTAQVAELADALDSGSSGRKVVEVRVLSWAPHIPNHLCVLVEVRSLDLFDRTLRPGRLNVARLAVFAPANGDDYALEVHSDIKMTPIPRRRNLRPHPD